LDILLGSSAAVAALAIVTVMIDAASIEERRHRIEDSWRIQ